MLSISTTKIQKNSYFFTISPSLLKTNNIFFSGNVWGVREKCVSLHKENNNNLNLETMMNMSNPKDSERPPPAGGNAPFGKE